MITSALAVGGVCFSSAAQQIENRPPRPCNELLPRVGVRGLRETNLWPNGTVYYLFDSNVTSGERQAALDVMTMLESVCDVTFTARTLSTQPYIYIHDSTENSSYVGMQGGGQDVNIYNWGFPFIIAHELMHALGIRHEQQRSDRDTYIIVNTGNIASGREHNFAIASSATPTGPYDFDSVMHYGAYDFSSNGNPTIEVRPPYDAAHSPIGQRDHLSDGDMLTLQTMYGAVGAPSNDACFGAIDILPGDHLHGTLLAATSETDSFPACAFSDGNPGVWYRFVAPADGDLSLTTCGTNDTPGYDLGMDTVLDVWSTCLVSFTSQLACNDDDSNGLVCGSQAGAALDSGLTLSLTSGDQVMIRVSHFGASFADGGFDISADFRQTHDDCQANAVPITEDTPVSGDTSFSTSDDGVDVTSCASGDLIDDWYTFTPSVDGAYTFSLCDSSFDTTLSVWDGCSSAGGVELACDDDSSCGLQSQLTMPALASGTTYYVRVSGYSGATGPYTLRVTLEPPANDDCADAITVSAGQTVTGTTVGSSTDGSSCATGGYHDVWYALTPPTTGLYTIDTCGSTFDTVLSVHGGCPGGGSNLVACNDDSCDLQSSVSADLTAGVEYLIRVAAFNSTAIGDFTLSVSNRIPRGACCQGGLCSVLTEADCANAGGVYQGDDTDCGPPTFATDRSGTFVDISSTGTALGLGDDGEANISTANFGTVRVGNNGAIGLTDGGGAPFGNEAVPTTALFNGAEAFAVFWDDLDSDAGDVYWQETGGTLIVQWNNRPHYSGSGLSGGVTFEVKLFTDGPNMAQYIYQDAAFDPSQSAYDNGASATVGYQSDGTSGVQFSYNTPSVMDGMVLTLVRAVGPCAPSCPCETDGDDAQVNVFDLLAYLSDWFPQNGMSGAGLSADYNGDSQVDVFDLLDYLSCWFPASAGNPCP